MHRWEDNIYIDVQGIGWECVEWINQADDREKLWVVLNIETSCFMKCVEFK
jgi:hypothetical protein